MGLTASHLGDMVELFGGASAPRDAVARWRERHPEVRAMFLEPADMRGEVPLLTIGYRSLYLVATNGHCWSVTLSPEEADGIILTEESKTDGHR